MWKKEKGSIYICCKFLVWNSFANNAKQIRLWQGTSKLTKMNWELGWDFGCSVQPSNNTLWFCILKSLQNANNHTLTLGPKDPKTIHLAHILFTGPRQTNFLHSPLSKPWSNYPSAGLLLGNSSFHFLSIKPSFQKTSFWPKDRKNCECCPVHSLWRSVSNPQCHG